MKVLHIISAPAAGGAEVFVKDLILNSKKFDIEPAVLFVSSANELQCSEDYEKGYLRELNSKGVMYYFLNPGSRRNLLTGKKEFIKSIEDFNPDCIHSHLLSGVLYSKVFTKKIPLVYTHHNIVVSARPFIFKLIMRFCNVHISISGKCKNMLDAFLPRKISSKLIYNAVDTSRIKSCQVRKSNATELRVLAVGRITAQKNYELMLHAIMDAKNRVEGKYKINLRIAGEGDSGLLNRLKNIVIENNLTENVEFLGNRKDIPKLMEDSQLFLMSSAWEGLPIVLLEAVSSGLPILVTDVGGCKEIVKATDSGIAVPPNSIVKLADGIIQFLEDPSLMERYSFNALKNNKIFTIEKCIDQHFEVYKNIVCSNKKQNL